MIFLMSFEMLSELNDTICQQRDLHFRRPGVGLVVLIPGYYLPLCFCHQCHLKVATPFHLSAVSFLVLYQRQCNTHDGSAFSSSPGASCPASHDSSAGSAKSRMNRET